MRCSNCQLTIAALVKFCAYCGTAASSAVPAYSPAPSPVAAPLPAPQAPPPIPLPPPTTVSPVTGAGPAGQSQAYVPSVVTPQQGPASLPRPTPTPGRFASISEDYDLLYVGFAAAGYGALIPLLVFSEFSPWWWLGLTLTAVVLFYQAVQRVLRPRITGQRWFLIVATVLVSAYFLPELVGAAISVWPWWMWLGTGVVTAFVVLVFSDPEDLVYLGLAAAGYGVLIPLLFFSEFSAWWWLGLTLTAAALFYLPVQRLLRPPITGRRSFLIVAAMILSAYFLLELVGTAIFIWPWWMWMGTGMVSAFIFLVPARNAFSSPSPWSRVMAIGGASLLALFILSSLLWSVVREYGIDEGDSLILFANGDAVASGNTAPSGGGGAPVVAAVDPAPTPTPLPPPLPATATPTPTPVPTSTPTPPPTATATLSPTLTPTPLPTATPTLPPTATPTPLPTATPTLPPTATPRPTPTPTPRPTTTPVPTPTPAWVWQVHEDTSLKYEIIYEQSFAFSSLTSAGSRPFIEVRTKDFQSGESTADFFERHRAELIEMIPNWNLFELGEFWGETTEGRNYVHQEYLWQPTAWDCIYHVVDHVFRSRFYPARDYGFIFRVGFCEQDQPLYEERREYILASFGEYQ